jgi:sugar lactone lactonase YvrE
VRSTVTLLLLIALTGCGQPKNIQPEQITPEPTEDVLLYESEISGTVLGQPLQSPRGIVAANDGSFILIDAEGNRLVSFDSADRPVRQAGGFGYGEGTFNNPTFGTWDSQLNLIVTDENNRRLVRVDLGLNFVEEILLTDDDDPMKFRYPSGVAVNSYGETWVADRDADRLLVLDNVGQFDRFVGDFGYSGGQLSSPEKVLIDERDNIIVCDAGNARLIWYDAYGNFEQELADESFVYPIACDLDEDRLWVLDRDAGVICFNREGSFLFQSGRQILGDSQELREPSDIAVLDGERIIIADTGNRRLVICRVVSDGQ